MLLLPNMMNVWKSNHNLEVPDWVLRWLLWMRIHKKTSELLDREIPGGSEDIPHKGTSAVLAIKQEPQGLVMPAKAALQNQQEVSVVVQRRLEAFVYGGMTMDKS